MSNVDQRWEFSAPKFVDFNKLQQEDGVDDWFETRKDSPGGLDSDVPAAVSMTRGSIAPKAAAKVSTRFSRLRGLTRAQDDDDDALVSQLATKFGLTTPKEFNFATSKRCARLLTRAQSHISTESALLSRPPPLAPRLLCSLHHSLRHPCRHVDPLRPAPPPPDLRVRARALPPPLALPSNRTLLHTACCAVCRVCARPISDSGVSYATQSKF